MTPGLPLLRALPYDGLLPRCHALAVGILFAAPPKLPHDFCASIPARPSLLDPHYHAILVFHPLISSPDSLPRPETRPPRPALQASRCRPICCVTNLS